MKQKLIKIALIMSAVTMLIGCIFVAKKVSNIRKENVLLCDHEYKRFAVTKEATCEEDGTKTYFCEICGHEKHVTLPATGHTEEIIVGKAAGCEESGISDGVKCAVCEIVIKEQEELSATGHDYKPETAIAVSCMEDGKINHICENCGKVILETKEATGHNYVNGECTKCHEPITVMDLTLANNSTLDYTKARPTFAFYMQAPLNVQKALTNDEEIGALIVKVEDIEKLENASETTDWVKALEEAGIGYTYKRATFNGIDGVCLSDAILYEEMTSEFVAIPCIKTVREVEHLTSYRYARNFFENYKEYSTSIAYLTGNHLNSYAIGEATYTQTQLINLNNYIDEIVDLINGCAVPTYDGSFLNFGQDENNEIQAEVIETDDGVIVSWDLPWWLFNTKLGIICDFKETGDWAPKIGNVSDGGLKILVDKNEWQYRKGIGIQLFGYKFSLGFDLGS